MIGNPYYGNPYYWGAPVKPPHSGIHWFWIMVVIIVIIAAAGGGIFVASSLSSSGPSGYLYTSSSEVLFVQVTRNSGQLAGTITDVRIPKSDPSKVKTVQVGFTGISSGSSVTLVVGGELFGTTVTGTLSDSTLLLSIPGGGGSLTNYTLYSATVGTYNKAVAALHKSAAEAYQLQQKRAAAEAKAQAQAQAQARQQAQTQAQARQQAKAQAQARQQAKAQAQARQQADQAIMQVASALNGDLSTLAQDATFTSQLAAMSQSLSTTQAALEKTQQKAQEVEALAQAHPNGDSGTVCADAEAGVVADAEAGVGADAQDEVGADAQDEVEPEIQITQGDIATVQHDLAALESAEANAPSYHPAGVPSASSVQQAISNAQASIQAAVNTANSDISTANGYTAAAYKAADQAIAAGNCGAGLNQPQQVPPINANAS